MSRTISPATQRPYGVQRVCRVWGFSRASFYRRCSESSKLPSRRGPKPIIEKSKMLEHIKEDICLSPFKGEGHRKIHARLLLAGKRVGRNQVLELMRDNQLLSPHRSVYRRPTLHDGRIVTDVPNQMWGSDGTKVQTVEDGWVWVFSVAEHWNSECMGVHVCKTGDRFAALEPVMRAVKNAFGSLEKGVAQGLSLRIDNGSQYTSDYFLEQLAYWGIKSSFGLVRQPETNGVSERFHRTIKEQVIEGRVFKNVGEVREVVDQFVQIYNEQWLVAKRGYQSPLEARRNHERLGGAA